MAEKRNYGESVTQPVREHCWELLHESQTRLMSLRVKILLAEGSFGHTAASVVCLQCL